MKKFILWCFAAFVLSINTASAEASKKVQVVADYSNITTSMKNDPHQSGYAVVIYRREDGLLFGDFTVATDSTEAEGSRLFELRFADGDMTFKAKTSAHQTSKGASRELFEFKGHVRGNLLTGTLTRWNGYDLKQPEIVRRVTLKKSKTAVPISYEVHQQIFAQDPW